MTVSLHDYRPRNSVDHYVVLLQSNTRILIAKRAMARAQQLYQRLLVRDHTLPELETQQESKERWNRYVAHCKKGGTHPVSKLQDQLSSGGLTLSHYPLNVNGLSSVTSMITDLMVASKLTYLSLTNMDINSSGIEILAARVCSITACPVRILTCQLECCLCHWLYAPINCYCAQNVNI